MKALVKMIILALVVSLLLFIMQSGTKDNTSNDMESAKGSSPSPSYSYELQIFHAF
jgi:hypothetical protein